MNAQRESASLHDLNEKLEQELKHKDAQIKVNINFNILKINHKLINGIRVRINL